MRWRARDGAIGGGRPAGLDALPAAARSRRQAFLNRTSHLCRYCELPVRLTGEDRHPGYGVVEQVAGLTGTVARLPDLVLLHRFCAETLRSRTNRRALRHGLMIRRAHLGWATEQYLAGNRPKRYDRLGLGTIHPSSAGLYQRHWRVRRMRYAVKACRYYPGAC